MRPPSSFVPSHPTADKGFTEMSMSGKMEHFLAVDKNSPSQQPVVEKETVDGINVLEKYAPLFKNIVYADFDTKASEILNIAVRPLPP